MFNMATPAMQVHPPTDRPLAEPPKKRRISLFVLLGSLAIVVLAAFLLLSFVLTVRPVPATKLDHSDCPFGESGVQAWDKTNRYGAGGTSYGYRVPDVGSLSTFLRHPSLEPDRVLCIFDLNYAVGSPGPFPTKPLNLLITAGVPWSNRVGTMFSAPGSERPFGIVLTGAAADEFMKNGPTPEQINELLMRSKP